MLVGVDHQLDQLLAFSLSKAPSKRLERRAYFYLFLGINQKVSYVLVV